MCLYYCAVYRDVRTQSAALCMLMTGTRPTEKIGKTEEIGETKVGRYEYSRDES
jgi:hypothetical protein